MTRASALNSAAIVGEFAGRAAAPGAHVHLEAAGVGGQVEFGQQPPFERVRVPQQPDYLTGHRLAVHAG